MARRPEPEWLRSLREEGALDRITVVEQVSPRPKPRRAPRPMTVVEAHLWTREQYHAFQRSARTALAVPKQGYPKWQPTGRPMRERLAYTGPRDRGWVERATAGFKATIRRNGGKRPLTPEQRERRSRAVAASWLPGGKRYEAQQRRRASRTATARTQ